MFLGAPSPASRSRFQLVDLNLVPPEYRRRPFPFLSVGLVFILLGGLLLLYAALYVRTYGDLEVAQLATRVSQARAAIETATGDSTARARAEQLRAMRDDYRLLTERQVHWGDILQVIADVPPGIILDGVSQAGFGVTVRGSAASQEAAARYLERLRTSGLFLNAAIQMAPARNPAAFETPTPPTPPVQPSPAGTPPLAPVAVPPSPTPRPITIVPSPISRPSPAAPSPTATRTATPTVTASPTPAYDYVLASVTQIPLANPFAPTSDITGKIVDRSGKPVTGIQVQIQSEGWPRWSATQDVRADGTFDFAVTHGKFQVVVLSGRAQPASDLYTGADGVPGVYGYQLLFRATFSGATPPPVVGTATLTPTPTVVPTDTPTPVAPGANIAGLGCATAYMVQNGVAKALPGGSDPRLAIDGNLGTEWNAGMAPSSGTQIIWQWTLPRPGQAPPGCTAAGLSDAADQIDGFQLIPDQNPAGATTHELWLYSDPACTTNLQSTNTPYYTWQQSTSAGQILPLRVEPPLAVRCVIIRTLTDPSFVAWEEVQIFQELPPPGGFSTSTPTPTSVLPTATPTITPTALPATPTPSATLSPTVTLTPTPSLTPLPIYPGTNIAQGALVRVGLAMAGPSATPIACSVGPSTPSPTPWPTPWANPCAVIDGDPQSYWAPPPGAGDPQVIAVILPTPANVADVRLRIQSAGDGSQELYQVWTNSTTLTCTFNSGSSGFPDGTQFDCAIPTPTVSSIASVNILMKHDDHESG